MNSILHGNYPKNLDQRFILFLADSTTRRVENWLQVEPALTLIKQEGQQLVHAVGLHDGETFSASEIEAIFK